MTTKQILLAGITFISTCIIAYSCTHAPYVLPVNQRTGDPSICFERDILPIFISNCAKSGCHDAASHESGYSLDNYTNIMKKGIVPGNVAASRIWESVAIKEFGIETMPPAAPALSATDLYLLRRWIETGAVDSGACNSICDSNNISYSAGIQPLMQRYCTGCHNSNSAPGGSLTDYASVREAAVNGNLIGNIAHLPGYKPMPTTGVMLTACEIAQVKKWVTAGALNN